VTKRRTLSQQRSMSPPYKLRCLRPAIRFWLEETGFP
jgi:hypothetical protein